MQSLTTSVCRAVAYIWSTSVPTAENGFRPIRAWQQAPHFWHRLLFPLPWTCAIKMKQQRASSKTWKTYSRDIEYQWCVTVTTARVILVLSLSDSHWTMALHTTSSSRFAQVNDKAERAKRQAMRYYAIHPIRI